MSHKQDCVDQLARIAEAIQECNVLNERWVELQKIWRSQDLELRKNWEEREQARFEHRMQEDHKILAAFHARMEKIYQEEVRQDLQRKAAEFLMEKARKRNEHEI